MKILFANIIPWRPHNKHMNFMARECQKLGYNTDLLVCSGKRQFCYQKTYNDNTNQCWKCWTDTAQQSMSGYFKQIHSLRKFAPDNLSQVDIHSTVLSSVASITREEFSENLRKSNHINLKKIQRDFDQVKSKCEKILQSNRYDIICIFNGRFHDVGALVEAAKSTGTPFVTHERAMFGDGIQLLLNESCLSLSSSLSNVDQALTHNELQTAYNIVHNRIFAKRSKEWRDYKQKIDFVKLRTNKKDNSEKKILIIPSSFSEFIGTSDYVTIDGDNSIQRLERFINNYKIPYSDIVIRAHPAWAVPMGHVKRSVADRAYSIWAERHNVEYIPPESKISTYELLSCSKLAVLNGGSTALEATLLRVPTVTISPAPYVNSGFCEDLSGAVSSWPKELPYQVTTEKVVKMLRYVNFRNEILPVFNKCVISKSSNKLSSNKPTKTEIDYFQRLMNLAIEGKRSGLAHHNKAIVSNSELKFCQEKLLKFK